MTFSPAIIISIGFIVFVINTIGMIRELNTLQHKTNELKHISRFITDLQQERGLSNGYLGSKGTQFGLQVKQKRSVVDHDHFSKNYTALLSNLRREIDRLNISMANAFATYTSIIEKLQVRYLTVSKDINDPYLLKQMQAYRNLVFIQEALGKIRGSLNGIFSSKYTINSLLYYVVHAKGVYDISLNRFYASCSRNHRDMLREILESPDYAYLDNIVKKYTTLNIDKFSQDPVVWFKKSTNVIDYFAELQKAYLLDIDTYTLKHSRALKMQFALQTVLFLLFIFVSLWIGYRIKNGILRNIALLNQYKETVDRSSIVSKTDKGGRITYANDKFCSISKYSKEELIGKPHNIVRHPDMPKSAFKDMWDTILAQKPWFGIVKNRAKDGSSYIVEATINPIVNHLGEIEEFIAIRNDITDVISLHDELESTQEELIFRMGEIGETRSQETGLHVKRVAKYSELLAQLYELQEEEIKYLTAASPMHDIGKVGISDDILNKPGTLTDEEWEIMKTHSEIGYELFKDSDKPLLKAAATIAYEHHEKYDGSGYPRALQGEKIHIYGRITALADVFDALGSDRSYKKAWDDAKIFALLKEEKGKHFDPKLVDLFFENLDEFLKIRDTLKEV